MHAYPSGLARTGEQARAKLDLVGVAVLGLSILWISIAAADRAARIMPGVLLLLALAAAYVIGRTSGVPHAVTLPATVACVIALLLALGSSGARSVAPPLGYGNANGALGVQGIAAAVMAAVSSWHPTSRRTLYAVAALLLIETGLTRSLAATLTGVVVLGTGLIAPVVRGRRLLAASGLLVICSGVVATTVIGARYQPHQRTPESVAVAQDVLSSRRVQLWHDAVTMVRDDPVRGVGPGRFSVESPTARSDPDARWAHSAALQQAAEQGLPGVVLLGAMVGWAFAVLIRSPRPDPLIACALAGLIAFVVQASVDYIAYFPAIPIVLVLLLGVVAAPLPPGGLPQPRKLRR
jgi:O-antigen ligase